MAAITRLSCLLQVSMQIVSRRHFQPGGSSGGSGFLNTGRSRFSSPAIQAKVLRCFASGAFVERVSGRRDSGRSKSSQVFGALFIAAAEHQATASIPIQDVTGDENSSGAVFEVRALRVGNIQAITAWNERAIRIRTARNINRHVGGGQLLNASGCF